MTQIVNINPTESSNGRTPELQQKADLKTSNTGIVCLIHRSEKKKLGE